MHVSFEGVSGCLVGLVQYVDVGLRVCAGALLGCCRVFVCVGTAVAVGAGGEEDGVDGFWGVDVERVTAFTAGEGLHSVVLAWWAKGIGVGSVGGGGE